MGKIQGERHTREKIVKNNKRGVTHHQAWDSLGYTQKGVGGYGLDHKLFHLGLQIGLRMSFHCKNLITHFIQVN